MSLRMDGIQATQDYLEQVRQNILQAIRVGMYEGMESLAVNVVERLAEVTEPGTGEFAASILKSPRIWEKAGEYIAGKVSTGQGKYRNLGLWIEFGTKFPTKGAGLGNYPQQFLHGTTAEGVAKHAHGAFRIAPRPFFNPAFEEYYPTILDTISDRIADAIDASSV